VREVLKLGAEGSAVPLGRLDDAADAVTAWLSPGAVAIRQPVADLSGWSPAVIEASYRAVVDAAMGAGRPGATRYRPPVPRDHYAGGRGRVGAGQR